MSFFSTSDNAFGLDISDNAIRLIQLAKKGRKLKVQFHNEIRLPSGCIKAGKIIQQQAFSEQLKKLVGTRFGWGKINREAIAALPEANTYLKTLLIPDDLPGSLPEKIAQIIPQALPLEMTEIYCDWQISEKLPEATEVTVGAAPKEIVDSYLDSFAGTGIIPAVFEIEAAAISRLLAGLNGESGPILIIDLGYNRTGLSLSEGGKIKFAITLNIAGKQIDELISQALDLPLEDAEQAKIMCGLDRSKCQGALRELLLPTLEQLSNDIKKAIKFYYDNDAAPQEIAKIIICGGASNTPQLAETLSELVGLKVEKSQPFKNIINPAPAYFTEDVSQSYVTALGLALRGLEPDTFYD